jgi:hypothetical protein
MNAGKVKVGIGAIGVTRQPWAYQLRIEWRNVARVLLDNQPPEHVVQ